MHLQRPSILIRFNGRPKILSSVRAISHQCREILHCMHQTKLTTWISFHQVIKTEQGAMSPKAPSPSSIADFTTVDVAAQKTNGLKTENVNAPHAQVRAVSRLIAHCLFLDVSSSMGQSVSTL